LNSEAAPTECMGPGRIIRNAPVSQNTKRCIVPVACPPILAMLRPLPPPRVPMKDWIRNALSIRQPRRPAPVGQLPPVGALIMRGPVKMLVTHPLPAELWDWLVLSGWRNMPVKDDRRKGMQLPEGALKALIDADPAERNQVHARILELAEPEV